jgi:porin
MKIVSFMDSPHTECYSQLKCFSIFGPRIHRPIGMNQKTRRRGSGRKVSAGIAFLTGQELFLGLSLSALLLLASEARAQSSTTIVPAASLNAGQNANPPADATMSPANAGDSKSSYERAVSLNAVYGLKGWNIAWPSFGDTITKDYGGWRTSLAQYGLSFLLYDVTQSAVNLLNTPGSNNGKQAYWGQSPDILHYDIAFLQYDLSRWHIPDGQLQIAGLDSQATWKSYLPTMGSLYRLAYYQTFFDRSLEFNAGYMSGATSFVGNFVGGQIQNPFGPSASIPVEVGLAQTVVVQPMAWLKYHLGNFYEIFGVARSIDPVAGAVVAEGLRNPTQGRFTEPGTNPLYADEVGYKTAASSNSMYTWVRAGAIYNFSQYHNYETNGTTQNYALYLLADRQLARIDSSKRGVYAGVSWMYAPPDANIYSEYFEARLYALGLFNARPADTITFVWAHNSLSSFYANAINAKSPETDLFAAYSANSYTLSYNMRVTNGVYLTLGLQYTDHPSASYIPSEGHALNFLASTYIAF